MAKNKDSLVGIVVGRFLRAVSMKTNRRVSIRFLPPVFSKGRERKREIRKSGELLARCQTVGTMFFV